MGSRYGGLKQLDSVGPSGEVVLDYAVHDAIWAGFKRVVFVIRKDFEDEFREIVVSRYASSIQVDLVYQDLDDLPEGCAKPAGREKPWGTGHAIWASRNVVKEPFLVVNADDFYGMEAYSMMGSALEMEWPHDGQLRMAMVAYSLSNTLSEHGAVSRGICEVTPDQKLASVEECTGIVRREDGRIVGMDTAGLARGLGDDAKVSMNFWGFTPDIFPHLDRQLAEFVRALPEDKPKAEFYIPSAVSEIVASGQGEVNVLRSSGRWFGVTYREDRDVVAAELAHLVNKGLYPTPLWKHTK